MGAKAPSKLNLRRPTYKCEQCSKKFLSAQALKSHQYCVHKIKGGPRSIKEKIKLSNLLGKSVKNEKSLTPKTGEDTKKVDQGRMSSDADGNVTSVRSSDNRKVEFECPQCQKLFNTYYTAFKHIQKLHSINNEGKRVDPESPDMIKPVLVELCTKCSCRVRPIELHFCFDSKVDSNLLALNCICSGCDQQFSSIQLFDLHVSGLHCDSIESMFFPTMNEFLKWKRDMELDTSSKYLILNKCLSKQILRCTFFINDIVDKIDNSGNTHLCPSSVVLREYSKGIQVHFYKQHHGHPSPMYNVPNKYKKYTITSLMDKGNKYVEEIDMTDDTDLYVQFKTLMDNMVIDAAKLKIDHLKKLIAKALEMTTILKFYTNDDDTEESTPAVMHKTMTDVEITKALETITKDLKKKKDEPSATLMKRENDSPTMNLRARPKAELVKTYGSHKAKTPTIVSTFSMADEKAEEKIVPKKTDPIPEPVNTNSPKVNKMVLSPSTISSFNDSYRDFVGKTFAAKDKPSSASTRNTHNKIKILSKNDINEKLEQNVPNVPININPSIVITKTKATEQNVPIDINPNIVITRINTTDSKNNTNGVTDSNLDKSNKVNNIQKTKKIIKTNNINKPKNVSKTNHLNKPDKINKNNKTEKNKPNNRPKVTLVGKFKKDKKIMKTKIGQFKPSLSPTKDSPDTSSKTNVSTKTETPNTSSKSSLWIKKQTPNTSSKTSLWTKKQTPNTSSKTSISNKKPTPNKSFNTSTNKVKTDFEYEVMEQENDCNILILKI